MSLNIENLIDIMKEIIELKDLNDIACQEIKMWRDQYLHDLPKYECQQLSAFVWWGFNCIPVREFRNKNPLEHIKSLEELWKKNLQKKN